MAALADDKGWTFDAFDPGTLRESVWEAVASVNKYLVHSLVETREIGWLLVISTCSFERAMKDFYDTF